MLGRGFQPRFFIPLILFWRMMKLFAEPPVY